MYDRLKKVCFPSIVATSGYSHVYLPMDYRGNIQEYDYYNSNGFCRWECNEQVCTDTTDKWTGGIEYGEYDENGTW